MSDSTIHDLPAAATVSATDVIPIDQGLNTVKATVQQVSAVVGPINVGVGIHNANAKTTPIDPDELGIVDTADGNTLKKLTWANLKATLLSYFSALTGMWNISTTGNAATATTTTGNAGSATKLQTARNLDVTSFDGTADVTIVAPAIHAATNKTTPVDADEAGIYDSVSGLLNKVTWANIKTTLSGTFTTIASLAGFGGSALVGFLQSGTGAVARTVQSKMREEVSVTDFGAIGDGIADDTAAIQAALDEIKIRKGTLYLPPGTYKLNATGIHLIDASDIIIKGAGMGATIIDGSAVNTISVFVLGNASGQPATCQNIKLADFTIFGNRTASMVHVIEFRGINNFVLDSVEVYGGYYEMVYCDGPLVSFDGLTVKNCYLHHNYGAANTYAIDINTIGVTNVLIQGNRFETIGGAAVYALGKNVNVTDNLLLNCHGGGIFIAESNTNISASGSSCVVSGNTFIGLGNPIVGGFSFTISYGIKVLCELVQFLDGTRDNGVVIANNTFKDSYAPSGQTLFGIHTKGNCAIFGNYASILKTDLAGSIFIHLEFTANVGGVNAIPGAVFLNDNILENTEAGVNWRYGLYIRSVDNVSVYCSNNSLFGSLGGAQFYDIANGFTPLVAFNGDKIAPYNRLYQITGTDANLGANPPPVYGTNRTTFSTVSSRDLFPSNAVRNITGMITPDVSAGNYFFTNNAAPISITDFSAPVIGGIEITIMFSDTNTTIVHNINLIVLNGSVNFVSTRGASLTLYKPFTINNAWYEKSRSKP